MKRERGPHVVIVQRLLSRMKSLAEDEEEMGGTAGGDGVSAASTGGVRFVGRSSSGSLLILLIVLARLRLFSGGGGRSFFARRCEGEATAGESLMEGSAAKEDERGGCVGVAGGAGEGGTARGLLVDACDAAEAAASGGLARGAAGTSGGTSEVEVKVA